MAGGDVRTAEVLGSLSLAADLGNGFEPEHAVRVAAGAARLARAAGFDDADVRAALYSALLRQLGCTALDYEMGHRYGDPAAARREFARVDFGRPSKTMPALVRGLGKGQGASTRARVLALFLTHGKKEGEHAWRLDCEILTRYSERLGTPAGVTEAVGQMFERWDGKGPEKIRGDALSAAMRAEAVAWVAVVQHDLGGREHAAEFMRGSSGGWLDPSLVRLALDDPSLVFEPIEADSAWQEMLDAEPEPRWLLPVRRMDDVTATFADFVDLRSPYMLGHSTAVGALAEAAASIAGEDGEQLRHAGRLHDIGRLSVPPTIWDREGPLSPASWERVRLHAYHTERILAVSPVLAPFGRLAGMHHERLDGSGYHRGSTTASLPLAARILAAADAFVAMTEPRAHRPPLAPDVAAKTLRDEAAAGRFDAATVNAVCEAAGQGAAKARAANPGGLSDREVEVLRLLARGRSKKEIAADLFISAGTVHTHVTHIYEKLGINGRASAALFAMENGLV